MALKFLEGFRLIQKKVHLLDRKRLDSEQVLQALEHFFLLSRRRLCGGSVSVYAVDDHHAFLIVHFAKTNFHNLAIAGFDLPANKSGFNWELAMAAINQDTQANSARPPQVEKPVHRGANSTAGVEHVVHNQQIAAVNVKINVRRLQQRLRPYCREIVPVQSYVQAAQWNPAFGIAFDRSGESLGERHAPASHPNKG